jgi:hypothetical protein
MTSYLCQLVRYRGRIGLIAIGIVSLNPEPAQAQEPAMGYGPVKLAMSEQEFLRSGAQWNEHRTVAEGCSDWNDKPTDGSCYFMKPQLWGNENPWIRYYFSSSSPRLYDIDVGLFKWVNDAGECRQYVDEKASLISEKYGKFNSAPVDGYDTVDKLEYDSTAGHVKKIGTENPRSLNVEMTRGRNRILLHALIGNQDQAQKSCTVRITYRVAQPSDNPF